MIPQGWEERTLGEICVIIAGQSPNSHFYNTEAKGLPFYQGKKEFTNKYIGAPNVWTTEITKEALAGDILMSIRAPVGPINYATEKCCIGRGLASIRNGKLISKDFLFYYLLSIQQKISGHDGAVFSSISRNEISALKILLPPSLSEQERIVAKLDKAFEAIDKVKANAEKDLNSAEELFESALNKAFTKNTDGWEEKILSEVLNKVKYTSKIQSKLYKDKGKYPIISQEDVFISGYWDGAKDVYYVKHPIVIFGDHTKVVKYVDFDFVLGADGIKILDPTEAINAKFLYYWAQYVPLRNLGYARHYKLLSQKTIYFPRKTEQERIVEKLDALQEQTKKLEQIYTQKIKECDELKQSILQKAFRGEL